jgi:acyl-CoA thioesterase YciA
MSTMSEPYVAIQVLMMPRDANGLPAPVLPGMLPNAPYLTIFGGVILSYIDQAGAIGARREVHRMGGPVPFLVTVAVNRVEFKQPVLVGDVVRFLTSVVRLGRTSITMHVRVEAERGGEVRHVTEAEVVYVCVDLATAERRPIPLLPNPGGSAG